MATGPLPAELDVFLRSPRPAVMGTVRPDSSPATTATWFDWDGERLLFSLVATSPRARNLRRDPRLALTVLGDSWYDHLSLFGAVVEFRDDPDLADLDHLSMRYYGTPYPKRGLRCVSALARMERWHVWGDPGAQRTSAIADDGGRRLS